MKISGLLIVFLALCVTSGAIAQTPIPDVQLNVGQSVTIRNATPTPIPATSPSPTPSPIATASQTAVPTATPTPTPTPSATLSFTMDATNTYYVMTYTGGLAPTNTYLFLDTDMNSATGWPTPGGIGADYAVCNGTLYKYAGTGGRWIWTMVATIPFTNGGGLAQWTIPQSLINSPVQMSAVGAENGNAGINIYTPDPVTGAVR
jgi:hypothetical protein